MTRWKSYFKEFVFFVLKEARASLFAASFLGLLVLSHYVDFSFISRPDFLFVGAILIQIFMITTKLETVDEAKTIALFHVIGLVLELYKTSPSVGSWTYPELGIFHISTVPLYSGFMYASIGSYIAQAWKILKVKLIGEPSYSLSLFIAILIYLNFFTNHFIYDFRWFLILFIFIVYFKTKIEFIVTDKVRKIPVTLSFVLIAFFIWIAENIGTFTRAWQYPNQITSWQVVSFHKVSSWSLLVIISFLLIAYLKHVKAKQKENTPLSS